MYIKGLDERACISDMLPDIIHGNLLNLVLRYHTDMSSNYFHTAGPDAYTDMQMLCIKLHEIGVKFPDMCIYSYVRFDLPKVTNIDVIKPDGSVYCDKKTYRVTELIPVTYIQYIVAHGLFDLLKYIYEHYPDKFVEDLQDYKTHTDRFFDLIKYWKSQPLGKESQEYPYHPDNPKKYIYDTIGFDACKCHTDMVEYIQSKIS
jgi:hypothetical protein